MFVVHRAGAGGAIHVGGTGMRLITLSSLLLAVACSGAPEASEATEAASGAQDPEADAQAAIAAWIEDHPDRRAATLADCQCEADLPEIHSEWDNADPYLVRADLNGDGREDIAFVALERSGRAPSPEEGGPRFDHWIATLVVLNGQASGGFRPVFEPRYVGSAGGSMLFHDREAGLLLMGPWNSSARSIEPDGETYRLSF